MNANAMTNLTIGTVSTARNTGDGTSGVRPADHLYVVMEGRRPLGGSARVSLHGVTRVSVAKAPGDARDVRAAGRLLDVRIPDESMSREHALFEQADANWTITDCGSKNGTYVNGRLIEPRTPVAIEDGDTIEVGRTFLLLRERVPTADDDPREAGFSSPVEGHAALITVIPTLRRAFRLLRNVAPSDLPILVLGETGTGKELLARAVHELSGRKGDLVAVNSGAMPENLVESELFGYARGAFSGASRDHAGIVRSADHGTLFLDEIGDLPPSAQAKLLRVLQEGEVQPVGTTRPIRVDVRVVAATHHDLPALVQRGRFRQDLYGRLAGEIVRLPPLRDRKEDLGSLIATLLARHAQLPAGQYRLTRSAIRGLLAYSWPQNIRELDLAIRAAVLHCGGRPIELEHLPEAMRALPPPKVAAKADRDAELRHRLRDLLQKHRGNVSAVAREMGKARSLVHKWMVRVGLEPERFRTRGSQL
jgi:transcriptional regulator with PAS, ATPase and Fis domain